jgi:hypothetical protein
MTQLPGSQELALEKVGILFVSDRPLEYQQRTHLQLLMKGRNEGEEVTAK